MLFIFFIRYNCFTSPYFSESIAALQSLVNYIVTKIIFCFLITQLQSMSFLFHFLTPTAFGILTDNEHEPNRQAPQLW